MTRRRPATPDLRTEGRHVTLTAEPGTPQPVTLCGLCSALIAVDDDGKLRHAPFHDATDTIDRPWTTP